MMEYQIKKEAFPNFIGKISEDIVKKEFLEKGYNIHKCAKQGRGKFGYFVYIDEKAILDFLKEYSGDKEKILKLMKENRNGLPDFLVFNDKELFFLEVKARTKEKVKKYVEAISEKEVKKYSPFSENQEKTFNILRKEGYVIRWYHMKIINRQLQSPTKK